MHTINSFLCNKCRKKFSSHFRNSEKFLSTFEHKISSRAIFPRAGGSAFSFSDHPFGNTYRLTSYPSIFLLKIAHFFSVRNSLSEPKTFLELIVSLPLPLLFASIGKHSESEATAADMSSFDASRVWDGILSLVSPPKKPSLSQSRFRGFVLVFKANRLFLTFLLRRFVF